MPARALHVDTTTPATLKATPAHIAFERNTRLLKMFTVLALFAAVGVATGLSFL